ncbi:AAA family ATPase [Kribbella sp. NPDC003505]|uniref:AAA family ATPase n=1 Tax=Kribbella sp. NPDC003505 TaxID=3154448 RepID=UPI0033B2B485
MLYGRQPECARIDEILRRARDGVAGTVLVRGEAGIGKSALLDYAAKQGSGMLVLRVSGVESETHLAFAGLHALLRPVFDAIDRLPPPQAMALRGALGLSDEVGRSHFLIAGGVVGLLSALADDQPVLCLIDDAQWLDAESVDTLVFAGRRFESDSVAMMVAVRADVDAALPVSLRTLPQLVLEPLDETAVDEFMESGLELVLDHRLRDAVIAAAGGNPLALVELSGENVLRGIGADSQRLPLSARLERAFLRRVELLPDGAQRLLLLAASDDSGQIGLLLSAGEALGASVDDLAAAERAGLVRVDESVLDFFHPLVRSAVYQSATFAERQRAHLCLADAAGAAPDRRTWHRAAAAVYPDADVADELEDLARAAERRAALETAAASFDRAASLTADPARRADRLLCAAELSWEYGRAEQACRYIESAEGIGLAPVMQARADHLKGRIVTTTGVVLDGYELLVTSAAQIAETDPLRAAAMLVEATRAASYCGAVDRVLDAGRRAAGLRVDGGLPPAACFVAGVAALLGGRPQEAAPLLRSALEAVEQQDDPSLFVWAGTASAYLGDFAGARSYGIRAVARAREVGAMSTLTQALELLSIGELPVAPRMAEADAVEGLRLARETGQVPSMAVHLSTITMVAAIRGDESRASDCAKQVMALAAEHGLAFPEARAEAALAVLDLGLGRPQQALERLDELHQSARHAGVSLGAAPDLVESAVRAGVPDRAAACLAILEAWVETSGSLWAQALLARSRAMLTDGAEADRLFTEALELENRHGTPLTKARTQLLYGEFLRRERRRAEARPFLRSAWEAFESFGAAPWAGRAQAELRATGESVRRRDSASIDELTPQERQIARLVATGASSKEVAGRLFLSPRTVDYHLRKIFSKTGITSRNQLRDLQLDS